MSMMYVYWNNVYKYINQRKFCWETSELRSFNTITSHITHIAHIAHHSHLPHITHSHLTSHITHITNITFWWSVTFRGNHNLWWWNATFHGNRNIWWFWNVIFRGWCNILGDVGASLFAAGATFRGRRKMWKFWYVAGAQTIVFFHTKCISNAQKKKLGEWAGARWLVHALIILGSGSNSLPL